MPLLDHFHPPLHPGRSWESFHAAWANALMGRLNETLLPARYYAEAQIHIGSRVEVDVATLEKEESPDLPRNGPGGVMTAEAWAPPAPPLVLPTVFPDEIELEIFDTERGDYLVGAVELVSPGNKDRAETRQAFAAKCSSYLQLGVGLLIIDVVTERLANLHDQLMALLEQPKAARFPPETPLYAAAYRPARRKAGDQIDCWPTPLALGQVLPVMPLALRGGPTLPLDLEVTYTEACRRSRL
jgi:hypothetical protein